MRFLDGMYVERADGRYVFDGGIHRSVPNSHNCRSASPGVSAVHSSSMGAWLGDMIGMDMKNTNVKQFESAMHSGESLILVDNSKDRVDLVQASIR